jgi:hypothetical protein
MIPDEEELWEVARYLELVEQGVKDKKEEQTLRRRFMFAPTQLLSEGISLIEEALMARHCAEAMEGCLSSSYCSQSSMAHLAGPRSSSGSGADEGGGAAAEAAAAALAAQARVSSSSSGSRSSCSSGAPSSSSTSAHCRTWRALDVGCGSGRNSVWLACREPRVASNSDGINFRWHVTSE